MYLPTFDIKIIIGLKKPLISENVTFSTDPEFHTKDLMGDNIFGAPNEEEAPGHFTNETHRHTEQMNEQNDDPLPKGIQV